MIADMTKLGRGPSVLATDADAQVQRRAGWGPTDFAGAFTAGVRFAARARPNGAFLMVGPVEVEQVGVVQVSSGQLCVFDPLDASSFHRTVLPLQRTVPIGLHPVYRSHADGETLVALVRFAEHPVSCWSPVRFGPDPVEMPIPPFLPMAPVRFGLALGDADRVAFALPERPLDAERVLRAIFGEPPLVEPVPRACAGARAPALALDALRDGLEAGERKMCSDGIVGFRADAGIPGWWGFDADGALVALALDFGVLRIAREDLVDVPIADVRSGAVSEVRDTRILALDADAVRLWVPAGSTFRSVVFLDQESGSVKSAVTGHGREVVVPANRELPAATVLRFAFAAPSLPAPRVPALAAQDLDAWLCDVIGA